MKANKPKTAITAVCLAACLVAAAAIHPLPTPPESLFPDRESSQNCQPAGIADEGRRVKMTLTFNATPTNAAQVAWGQDLNGDEDLEPEETMLVLGVDCGVPFTRDEGLGPRSRPTVEVCPPSSTTTSNLNLSVYTFSFKQPSSRSERVDFAKVTTWGIEDTAVQIAAEIKKPGNVLFLR